MAIKITIAEITLKNIATFEVQDQYCTQKALDAERAAHNNTARDLELRLAEQELQANILEQHREVIYALETCLEAERKAHAITANDLDRRLKELASIPSVSAMDELLERNDRLAKELATSKEANHMLHVRLIARNATIDAIKAQIE